MSNEITTQKKKPLVAKFSENLGVEPEKMMNTLKATAFRLADKDGRPQEVTNEQMMSLLVVADQYGLNPFTKEIYAYPDKGGIVPVVGVDGWARIINSHPQFDGMEFKQSEDMTTPAGGKECPVWMEVHIYRKDRTRPVVVREYIDEVYKQAKYASPWKSHTKRFFRHKTLIQGARYAFGYVGIFDQDEADNIIDGEVSNYKPSSSQETKADTHNDIIQSNINKAKEPIEAESTASGDPMPTNTTEDHQDAPKSPESSGSGTIIKSGFDAVTKSICGANTRSEVDLAVSDIDSYEDISINQKKTLMGMANGRINELTKTN